MCEAFGAHGVLWYHNYTFNGCYSANSAANMKMIGETSIWGDMYLPFYRVPGSPGINFNGNTGRGGDYSGGLMDSCLVVQLGYADSAYNQTPMVIVQDGNTNTVIRNSTFIKANQKQLPSGEFSDAREVISNGANTIVENCIFKGGLRASNYPYPCGIYWIANLGTDKPGTFRNIQAEGCMSVPGGSIIENVTTGEK